MKKSPIKITHPGSLTRLAAKAHETIVQYAEKHKHDKGDPAAEKKSDLYLNVLRPASRARKGK